MLRGIGGARIGLRINPALDADTHPHLATGAAGSKFGIALDDLPAALERVRPESIGAHIGSAIGDAVPFGRLARTVVDLADAHDIDTIDLGGGFDGAPTAWALAVRPQLGRQRVIVEPGRTIVGAAGWLLTRVVRVQARGHLVADAGMTELLRPMLYGARHPVTLLAPGATLTARSWTLSGPICEAGTSSPPVSTWGPRPARARCWRSVGPVPTAWRWPRTTTAVCAPRRPCSRVACCDSVGGARRSTT